MTFTKIVTNSRCYYVSRSRGTGGTVACDTTRNTVVFMTSGPYGFSTSNTVSQNPRLVNVHGIRKPFSKHEWGWCSKSRTVHQPTSVHGMPVTIFRPSFTSHNQTTTTIHYTIGVWPFIRYVITIKNYRCCYVLNALKIPKKKC